MEVRAGCEKVGAPALACVRTESSQSVSFRMVLSVRGDGMNGSIGTGYRHVFLLLFRRGCVLLSGQMDAHGILFWELGVGGRGEEVTVRV